MFPAQGVKPCHVAPFDRRPVGLGRVACDPALKADGMGDQLCQFKDRLVDSGAHVDPIGRLVDSQQMNDRIGQVIDV